MPVNRVHVRNSLGSPSRQYLIIWRIRSRQERQHCLMVIIGTAAGGRHVIKTNRDDGHYLLATSSQLAVNVSLLD